MSQRFLQCPCGDHRTSVEHDLDRLRFDLQFAEEMAYCAPLGIPHSILLGRVVASEDPQWTLDDLSKALAYKRFERLRCSNCGSLEEDWKDADGMPLAEPNYHVELRQCLGCQEIQSGQDELSKQEGGAPKGTYVVLAPGPFTPDP